MPGALGSPPPPWPPRAVRNTSSPSRKKILPLSQRQRGFSGPSIEAMLAGCFPILIPLLFVSAPSSQQPRERLTQATFNGDLPRGTEMSGLVHELAGADLAAMKDMADSNGGGVACGFTRLGTFGGWRTTANRRR